MKTEDTEGRINFEGMTPEEAADAAYSDCGHGYSNPMRCPTCTDDRPAKLAPQAVRDALRPKATEATFEGTVSDEVATVEFWVCRKWLENDTVMTQRVATTRSASAAMLDAFDRNLGNALSEKQHYCVEVMVPNGE